MLRQQKAYQRVVAPFDGVDHPARRRCRQPRAGGRHIHVHADAQRRHPRAGLRAAGPGVRTRARRQGRRSRSGDARPHFRGKVTRIADALQPGTRTLLTEIDVPNPDGALSPGIYCTVELQIPRKMPSLIVPADAIIFNKGGLQVAVVENGVVHLRKITVARDLGTQIEVRDGVEGRRPGGAQPARRSDRRPTHHDANAGHVVRRFCPGAGQVGRSNSRTQPTGTRWARAQRWRQERLTARYMPPQVSEAVWSRPIAAPRSLCALSVPFATPADQP